MTALTSNGTKPRPATPPWLQSSVQAFFTAVNWEDQPLEVQELKLTALQESGQPTLSLYMSVNRFFAAVNWDGSAIAADPVLPELAAPQPQDSFTLDDFSGLF